MLGKKVGALALVIGSSASVEVTTVHASELDFNKRA
jgi:hypothetical protein